MAIAVVASSGQKNNGNSASISVVCSPSPTAGNLLVFTAYWADDTATPGTPTDTLGTTYTLIRDTGDIGGVTGYIRAAMWWGIPSSSGANTISLTISASNYWAAGVTEFSGAHASAPFDVYSSNTATNGSTSAMSTGTTGTTAEAGEMLYALCATSAGAFSAPSLPSGYTSAWTHAGIMDGRGAYLLNQSVGTYSTSSTAGTAGWWAMILAAFKPAGGGGAVRRTSTCIVG